MRIGENLLVVKGSIINNSIAPNGNQYRAGEDAKFSLSTVLIKVSEGEKLTFSMGESEGHLGGVFVGKFIDDDSNLIDRPIICKGKNEEIVIVPKGATQFITSYPYDTWCKIERGDTATLFVLSKLDTSNHALYPNFGGGVLPSRKFRRYSTFQNWRCAVC